MLRGTGVRTAHPGPPARRRRTPRSGPSGAPGARPGRPGLGAAPPCVRRGRARGVGTTPRPLGGECQGAVGGSPDGPGPAWSVPSSRGRRKRPAEHSQTTEAACRPARTPGSTPATSAAGHPPALVGARPAHARLRRAAAADREPRGRPRDRRGPGRHAPVPPHPDGPAHGPVNRPAGGRARSRIAPRSAGDGAHGARSERTAPAPRPLLPARPSRAMALRAAPARPPPRHSRRPAAPGGPSRMIRPPGATAAVLTGHGITHGGDGGRVGGAPQLPAPRGVFRRRSWDA